MWTLPSVSMAVSDKPQSKNKMHLHSFWKHCQTLPVIKACSPSRRPTTRALPRSQTKMLSSGLIDFFWPHPHRNRKLCYIKQRHPNWQVWTVTFILVLQTCVQLPVFNIQIFHFWRSEQFARRKVKAKLQHRVLRFLSLLVRLFCVVVGHQKHT